MRLNKKVTYDYFLCDFNYNFSNIFSNKPIFLIFKKSVFKERYFDYRKDGY